VRILYFCDKRYWDTKMSRVRFHGIEAIARHPGVELVRDGPGFPGFEAADVSEMRHKPDFVMWYKPLKIPGYDIVRAPKVLRYNEMYERPITAYEINESFTDIVIHHHANETIGWYAKHCPDTRFVNIPHCANTDIFRPYNRPEEKDIDVSLVGALNPEHYPLRCRMAGLLPKLKGYRVMIHQHPGDGHADAHTNRYLIEYAKRISRTKIAVTCSSKWRYRLGKYVEIPLCGTALAADIPDDVPAFFSQFVIGLDMGMSDEAILDALRSHLENGTWQNKAVEGRWLSRPYTMVLYAERVVRALEAAR